MTYISPGASVEGGVTVGAGTKIWDQAKVRTGAVIGSDCVVGRNVFIDTGVRVGDRCKIQNNALVYAPATLGDGVFIGPSVVLTNDRYPRAVGVDGGLKPVGDWQAEGVSIRTGASIGAQSVIVAGVTVGAWSLVAAGAVVTKDVPAHGLVVGSAARQIGWVGHAGVPLVEDGAVWRCPSTNYRYALHDGELERIDD